MRFPIPAIVSILHRLSGVFLFLLIPVVLWGLQTSLASEDAFNSLSATLASPFIKGALWLFLAAFLFHLVAGIRHLLMDINIGIELKSGRLTAIITLVVAITLAICVGVCLW